MVKIYNVNLKTKKIEVVEVKGKITKVKGPFGLLKPFEGYWPYATRVEAEKAVKFLCR